MPWDSVFEIVLTLSFVTLIISGGLAARRRLGARNARTCAENVKKRQAAQKDPDAWPGELNGAAARRAYELPVDAPVVAGRSDRANDRTSSRAASARAVGETAVRRGPG